MSWEYIAGFFDGEGSLVRNGRGFRISISQTHEGVLCAIKQFTGYGSIIQPKKRQPHWKDSWIYFISKQENVHRFLVGVKQFLVVKKSHTLAVLPRLRYILKQQNIRRKRHIERRNRAIQLRQRGLAYWRIGLMMGGLDRSYIRRIILHNYK